ncbi:MAG TPA: tetratricopeptide repeat protein [Pirellulales bacterium]|nr:tetratricopeptide repeat protein [Pirellulales bacterium]
MLAAKISAKGTRLEPKNPEIYIARARAWQDAGEWDKALADFDEAIRLDPKNSAAYGSRGWSWENQGEWDKSLADFDEAIRLNPENSEAYASRAITWRLKGEYEKSLDDFASALDLDPQSIAALNGRAWIRATCPEEKFRHAQQALEDAKAAAELTEWSYYTVLETLAAAYAEAAMFDKAAEWQHKAIEFAPEEGKEDCRSRLKLYRERKPYRDEPKK